jgi:class 3 adenylate cyclase/GTPase SAR1 family protein
MSNSPAQLKHLSNEVFGLEWSPDGSKLAAVCRRHSDILIWDVDSHTVCHTLTGHGQIVSFDWSPDSKYLALANSYYTSIVDIELGRSVHTIHGATHPCRQLAWSKANNLLAVSAPNEPIRVIAPGTWELVSQLDSNGQRGAFAWSPDGRTIAVVAPTISFCDAISGKLVNVLRGTASIATCAAWSPDGKLLAAGLEDRTIQLCDAENTGPIRILESHTAPIDSVSFIKNGAMLASKANAEVRLWDCATWSSRRLRTDGSSNGRKYVFSNSYLSHLQFHPESSMLAVIVEVSDVRGHLRRWIALQDVYAPNLTTDFSSPSTNYVNAKVVLLGDTGVGKSALSAALNGQPYTQTDSTAGRHVWTLDKCEVQDTTGNSQVRETLLWDMAGQPGYRIIHQLHLGEVAVALVVFDARSETDPLAGVRHWERALRLAHQRSGMSKAPMRKLLVSARIDRGSVSVSKDRINLVLAEFHFDGFFETSAKEGWGIAELRTALEAAIQWNELPEVSSTQLFADIKEFLLETKKTGRLLAPVNELFESFAGHSNREASTLIDLRRQFDTCIGRLENRDLIRRMTFGGYLLLQPELLDAYGSALVNAAKDEPDGLGSLAEETALSGSFYVPEEQRITNQNQEQLLLHATVEELVRHDLALRENGEDGRHLVFPSQFNRDYEDAPEPKGKASSITFEGPVQSLYATLVVRLGHSELFATQRAEMWRNAAIFTAKAGGKCGLFLHEFAEARGRLILFFDELASAETRFHFEQYVLSHARKRALLETVEFVKSFVCGACGDPIPDSYVKRLNERGIDAFSCPCGAIVSLIAPVEQTIFRSKVDAMESSADLHRNFDAFVVSANGEVNTSSFRSWAGGDRVTLAIVFTDVVGSTALGEEIHDAAMNDVRRAHFQQSQKLIDRYGGRTIKTIGDSFMVAFKCTDAALDYAMALRSHTGHSQVRVRAGIHIGPMHVEGDDVFGGTVNFAARVVGAIKGAEIWLSDRAMDDIKALGAKSHKSLRWSAHESHEMKGFKGTFLLWSLSN